MLSKGIAALLSSIIFGGVLLVASDKSENTEPSQKSNVAEGRVQNQSLKYVDLPKNDQRQIDCLASNIYFEARAEPKEGQVAVAKVTLNRTSHSDFPDTVCEVVTQKRNSVCQFSWWCDAKAKQQALSKTFRDYDVYLSIRKMATKLYLNHDHMEDLTGGALFYHATYVSVKKIGVRGLQKTAHIGQHIFYRTKI